MKVTFVLILLLTSLVLLLPTKLAAEELCSGSCWSYVYIKTHTCTGPNCEDTWDEYVCGLGCVCGACHINGSSGMCCNTKYFEPNIYPGNGNCINFGCGEVPIHARTHLNSRNLEEQQYAELRQDIPGLIILSPTVRYRAPLLGYVFNHCTRSYALISEEGHIIERRGM